MTARILLVDDEKGIRKVLTIYLQDAGYDVLTSDNGARAASLIDGTIFDIVLTDIRMPGMDGIALLKHVKEKCPTTEVIMLTGHGDFKLAIESLKLDAVDFISKPIENELLDIALKRAHDRIDSRKKIQGYTKGLEGLVAEKTKKLAESEKKYSQLFNESPSYLTIQDKHLNIVETNKIFKDHFNYGVGMTCYEVYKGRTEPCPHCPVEKTFRDGKSHTAEMDVILKDASKRNIFIQTSAITSAAGEITHVMEMSTDVTMIRELQDHLVSLGLHIGSVSHGLKQLLTGIDGGSYLIESGLVKNDPPRIKEGWQIVKDKISKTRQMVLNILFHTKKRKPERSRVMLADLLKQMVSSVQPGADQENIALITDFPKENIPLYIDRMALFAAFNSILENAVDACREKKTKETDTKEIEIKVIVKEKENQIIFTIKDNGKGLKAIEKEKIFDLFYSDKGNKGTGLGLFIASRSIKQHGGSITVESELQRYTEFTIILPLKLI